MSNWKERKKELEQQSADDYEDDEREPLRVSYDEIEDEDDFQMIGIRGGKLDESMTYHDDTYQDLMDEEDGVDDDDTTTASTMTASEDTLTFGGHPVSGRYKISALEFSLDSFSHASLTNQPKTATNNSVDNSQNHNSSGSSLTNDLKKGATNVNVGKNHSSSMSSMTSTQQGSRSSLPSVQHNRSSTTNSMPSHSGGNQDLSTRRPSIPPKPVQQSVGDTTTTKSGSVSGSTGKSLPKPVYVGAVLSKDDEIELLKQQVSQLQLKNLELIESLQLSQKKGDNDIDLFEIIEHNNVEYDDYFRSPSAPSLPVDDDVMMIRNGLFGSDLSKSIISSNTRNYFYGRADEDFDYEDDVNISKLKEELCTPNLKYPHRYNLYDLDTKELEKNQTRAWCDIRSLRSLEKKRRLLRVCHYDRSKNYLNSDNDRRADNERFPIHYDALMAVLLDMEQSLTFREFMRCVSGDENRVYLDAYIGHLNRLRDYEQLMKVYRFHGLFLPMLMLQYHQAMNIRDPGARIQKLESIMSAFRLAAPNNDIGEHFLRNNLLSTDFAKHIVDSINLLGRQVRIEEHDSAVARQGRDLIYIENPRHNIIHISIADTLKYCLFYHPYADEFKLSSPKNFAQSFRLVRHRYLFEAARTRCRLKDWKSVEQLYKTALEEHLCSCSSYEYMNQKGSTGSFLKSKFSSPKNSTSILSVTSFLQLAMNYNAPKGLIEVFIKQCPDPQERCDLARKNQLYQIAVDCAIKELKDKELCIKLNKEIVEKLGAENSQDLREQINQYIMKGEKKNWLRKLF